MEVPAIYYILFRGKLTTLFAGKENDVEGSVIDTFKTIARWVKAHYESILNFFDNRSTNASAESFNDKIKAFRATPRGVRDNAFFLFRLAKLYA